MAASLFTGSEILFWNDPLGRPAWDWPLMAVLYLCLGAIVLDLLTRYRVHDVWGWMTVAGVYGLLAGLLIHPATGLADLPRTLITRVMGAHTLLGFEMIGLALMLVGGHLRRWRWGMVPGCLVIGLAWGVWVRWSPDASELDLWALTLETMLATGLIALLMIFVLLRLTLRRAALLSTPALRLDLRTYALIVLVMTAALVLRVAQGVITGPGLLITAILLALCAAVLWFRKDTRRRSLIENRVPFRSPSGVWLALVTAILLWAGTLGYSLPQIGNPRPAQFDFIVIGFALYGAAWLPTVTLVLGLRAYIRQTQRIDFNP
jgi:hypothetical protein